MGLQDAKMHIDWMPGDFTAYRGHLGITHMPGYQRSLDQDLAGLKKAGVQQLVCLQQAYELQRAGVSQSMEEHQSKIASYAIGFIHAPVGDFSTPSQPYAQQLVDSIYAQLEGGQKIVLHCFLGLGRAGTITACVLARDGFNAQAAIDLVREYRPGAIQTAGQEQFVYEFAERLKIPS